MNRKQEIEVLLRKKHEFIEALKEKIFVLEAQCQKLYDELDNLD